MNNRRGTNSSFDRKWSVERFEEFKYYPRGKKRRWCWQAIMTTCAVNGNSISHNCSYPKNIKRRHITACMAAVLILISARHLIARPNSLPKDSNSSTIDASPSSPSSMSSSSEEYCQYFQGVLWISQGDRNGAAGTIFFLFILNQLMYAERHNLQPFIHLNNVSRHVYDEHVHGQGSITFSNIPQPEFDTSWDFYQDSIVNKSYPYPGPPKPPQEALQSSQLTLSGNGVFESYFDTTIPMTLGPQSKTYNVNLHQPCPDLPLVHLQTNEQLVQGLHLNCPYCVRSWKYGGVPPSLKLPINNYQEWWAPMRQTGQRMVQTYFHPQPYLQQLVDQQVNPLLLPSDQQQQQQHCLAMHIRHSDKANKREKIPLEAFLPYCQAYIDAGGQVLYLATDSSRVISKIQETWPPEIVSRIRFQETAFRSPNETAVFDAILLDHNSDSGGGSGGSSKLSLTGHHRTNVEVLVDILAMAKCHWFLHGLSAVSEAVFYWSQNQLQDRSVNLEFYQFYKRRSGGGGGGGGDNNDAPMTIESFRQLLQEKGV